MIRAAEQSAALFAMGVFMRNLSIDLETYSSADIGKSGVYRYAEAHDFEILLFGYSFDGQPVQVVDLACGERMSMMKSSSRRTRRFPLRPSVSRWADLRTGCRTSCSAPMGTKPIFIKKTDMKIAAPGSSPEAAI